MRSAELSWDQIEATHNAANNKAGPRFVPGRSIPVPSTVSTSLQTTIAAPYRVPAWDADPKRCGGLEDANQYTRRRDRSRNS
jgi:hypothetical protein